MMMGPISKDVRKLTTSMGQTPPMREDGREEDTGTGNTNGGSSSGDMTKHKRDTDDDRPGGNAPPGQIGKCFFIFFNLFYFSN